MKGEITINSDEVRTMVENHIRGYLKEVRITGVKVGSYSDYDPSLVIAFTDEPEEKEE